MIKTASQFLYKMDNNEENVVQEKILLESIPDIGLGQIILDSLIANANHRAAMIDAHTGEEISYKTILELSCSLAECLKRQGYGKDTIIGISSENSLQFFIPICASLYVGAVCATINPAYTVAEFQHTLMVTKPKVLFCSKAVLPKFLNLLNEFNFIEKIIVLDSQTSHSRAMCLYDFIKQTLKGNLLNRFLPIAVDPASQLAFILCSSGTTGLPKGVMITHRNFTMLVIYTRDPRFFLKTATVLTIIPFFHGYGLGIGLCSIIHGEQIVLMKKFEEHLFLKSIQQYRIDKLSLTPPLMLILANSKLVDQYDLSSIKDILSGAAPLGKETEEIILKRLGLQQVRQGYGLTEGTMVLSISPLKHIKQGSCGKPLPYVKMAIRDPSTGKLLPKYEQGEVVVKGPSIMKGYYNNAKATKETFTSDGWLLTGDVGYFSKDNCLFIVDRIKELIKYKGYQVAPAELEALLNTHPAIQDAAVVGKPDPIAGELPTAFIVKKKGYQNLRENKIKIFVEENLSHYKRLRGGVIFIDAIPKTPSGKILRKNLRNILKQQTSKL